VYGSRIEFGVSVRPATLIKQTRNEARTGNYLADARHVLNGVKQGDAISSVIFSFALQQGISKDPRT
jgi:hypothetical protein